MSKYGKGKVFDMGGPLRCKLEEFDVVPLHAVNQNCRNMDAHMERERERELARNKLNIKLSLA